MKSKETQPPISSKPLWIPLFPHFTRHHPLQSQKRSLSVMASFTKFSVCLISLLLFSTTHLAFSFPNPNPSASFNLSSVTDVHELLPQFGLPRGLLPDNVESYTLSESGAFTIKFGSPCYVHFDQLVWYDKEIRGKLSYGAVSDVLGIQAKKLFIWLSVTGIEVSKEDDGMLEFFVGSLSEKLPTEQFVDVPTCQSKASLLRSNLLDSM